MAENGGYTVRIDRIFDRVKASSSLGNSSNDGWYVCEERVTVVGPELKPKSASMLSMPKATINNFRTAFTEAFVLSESARPYTLEQSKHDEELNKVLAEGCKYFLPDKNIGSSSVAHTGSCLESNCCVAHEFAHSLGKGLTAEDAIAKLLATKLIQPDRSGLLPKTSHN